MPILVTTALSTQATRAIFSISPGSLIPSSITAISASDGMELMVMGTPTWLLELPGVR